VNFDDIKALLQGANRRLFYLCLAFVVWTILGAPGVLYHWPHIIHPWYQTLVYIVVHFGLAGFILWTSRFRLWSIVFCLVGLYIGEQMVLLMFFAFTAWYFRGFV
jgi:hypothetical protein